MQALYAPGARVVVRDCEWIVRRADRSDGGGYILTVDGLAELVNGKSARFLTQLAELLTYHRVQFPVMHQYEAEACYDQIGRIVFTPSKGLVGVGLPRRVRNSDLVDGTHYSVESPDRTAQGIALGWEHIQHLTQGKVSKTFMDDTLLGGPTERTIENQAPSSNRTGSRVMWEIFSTQN